MYSPIFSGCFLPSGAEVSLSHHKVFCAEAEYGFVMQHDLTPRDEVYTEEEVWQAVYSFEPCIELCGARFTTAVAKASPYHLLADAMSNALVIRGTPIRRPATVPDPLRPSNRVRILVDGKEVSTGTGASNPGDSPLGALTFLVNDITHRRRLPLCAGHLVIAGHTCQVAFSSRPAPPSARTLPQAQSRSLDTLVMLTGVIVGAVLLHRDEAGPRHGMRHDQSAHGVQEEYSHHHRHHRKF